MVPLKLTFLITLELILEGCCQIIQVPQTCTCASSSPIITPGTFVIPAIIKPIIQPDLGVPAPAPIVPSFADFSSFGFFPPGPPPFPGPFGGFPSYPGPYGGIPPIIIDEDDDDRGFNWIYWLILALSRRSCGGGFGGFGGYGGGYGYGGGSNGGCCNCGGNCGGDGYNGFNFNNGFSGNGPYGCGGNGFGNSNGNCIYIPYPVPVPCGSSMGGFGPFDYPYEETAVANPAANELTLIIRTDQTPPPSKHIDSTIQSL